MRCRFKSHCAGVESKLGVKNLELEIKVSVIMAIKLLKYCKNTSGLNILFHSIRDPRTDWPSKPITRNEVAVLKPVERQ